MLHLTVRVQYGCLVLRMLVPCLPVVRARMLARRLEMHTCQLLNVFFIDACSVSYAGGFHELP